MVEDKEPFLEHRKGESGLRVGLNFFPFLKPGDKIDVIVVLPWVGTRVPGSKKGKCDRCGRDIALAPSTREVIKDYPDVPIRCIYCAKAELEEKK